MCDDLDYGDTREPHPAMIAFEAFLERVEQPELVEPAVDNG